MPYAYDFNRVPGPSPDEIKAADGDGSLVYGTGAQQPAEWVDAHESAELHVVRIWEHNVDSILYMDGAAECAAFEANNPPGLVYLACDLNDGALAGRDVTRFCREWCSVTREDAVGLYGSSTAIAQGQASGIPKLTKWWGVVNWIVGGGPDNAPQNIDYWRSVGAHIIQLIGSPIPDTDQNLILRDDWWTTGVPAPKTHPLLLLEDDVHFETDPADRRDIWKFEGNTRKHLTPDEWAIEKADHAFTLAAAGLPVTELKPFAGTPATFASTPDILTLVGGGSGGTAPTHFAITGDARAA